VRFDGVSMQFENLGTRLLGVERALTTDERKRDGDEDGKISLLHGIHRNGLMPKKTCAANVLPQKATSITF
jgi:hypothetical protein